MSRLAPTVDVLLSSYNGAEYISEQLDSILSQSYVNIRIIIRDDGSSDNTVSIIEDYKRKFDNIILVGDGDNVGSTESFLALLKHSTSQYVMFSDQDDVWLTNKVKNCLYALDNNSSNTPSLIYTDLCLVDSNLEIIAPSFLTSGRHYFGSDFSSESRLANNSVAGCTIMMNNLARDLIVDLGCPDCKVIHDHWIVVIISYFGRVIFLDKRDIFYRQHGANQVGSVEVGLNYFLKKIIFFIPTLLHDVRIYKSLYKLGIKLNLFKVFYYKVKINLLRFWRYR